jgi:hypothetical protein
MSRNQMVQQGTGKHQERREQLDRNENGENANRQK